MGSALGLPGISLGDAVDEKVEGGTKVRDRIPDDGGDAWTRWALVHADHVVAAIRVMLSGDLVRARLTKRGEGMFLELADVLGCPNQLGVEVRELRYVHDGLV